MEAGSSIGGESADAKCERDASEVLQPVAVPHIADPIPDARTRTDHPLTRQRRPGPRQVQVQPARPGNGARWQGRRGQRKILTRVWGAMGGSGACGRRGARCITAPPPPALWRPFQTPLYTPRCSRASSSLPATLTHAGRTRARDAVPQPRLSSSSSSSRMSTSAFFRTDDEAEPWAALHAPARR